MRNNVQGQERRTASGELMGWPAWRKNSLRNLQPRHDGKCASGNVVFDIRRNLVVTNRIRLIETNSHTRLTKLRHAWLRRLSRPDFTAARQRFASVWRFKYELGNYVADAADIRSATMRNKKR